MTWIEWLDKLDKIAFIFIHNDSDHHVLDHIFIIVRDPFTWIPLYIFILYFAFAKFKKNTWLFLILSVITFALCDRLSAGLLKPLFERPRPCFDPGMQPFLRNLIDCGGMYSFPSSHAANHFGLAGFWYWSVLHVTGKKWNWIWLWAAMVGYAQIYVGKHYPLDIAAGALIGVIVGTSTAKIVSNWAEIKKLFTKNIFRPHSLET